MKRIFLFLLVVFANPAVAGDDLVIQLSKFDAAGHMLERNYLQIADSSAASSIYYVNASNKGEVRVLLPGEFESIINAMKSQLSFVTLTHQAKPVGVPYYQFAFEYDVGAKKIEYRVRGITLDTELSPEMKAVLREYFQFSVK